MKKLFCALAFTILSSFMLFTFVGCNDNGTEGGRHENESEVEPPLSELYWLEEAYANGLITKDDLRAIAYYNNRIRDDSDFVPEPKPSTSLRKKTAQKIKQAYFETVADANTEATVDDVHIVYCGTYNGCVIFYIIFISDDGLYPPDCEIDGVTIASYKPIMAWKEVPLEANS